MRKDYEKLFKNLIQEEPPTILYKNILGRIEIEKRKTARNRLFFFAGLALISLASLVPATRYFIGQVNQSGLHQYLLLLFSDWNLVAAYWKDFILSVIQALPIMAAAAMLSAIFIFLESIRLATKNIKAAFTPFKLT